MEGVLGDWHFYSYPDKIANRGSNRKFVPHDIKEGTLVAYVVPSSDIHNGKAQILRPVSRLLLKPSGHEVKRLSSYNMVISVCILQK
jgi:hypothetical protein